MNIPNKFPPALYETYLEKNYHYDNALILSAGGCSGRETKCITTFQMVVIHLVSLPHYIHPHLK